MNNRTLHLVIYLAAVTLAAGLFLPLAQLPVIGIVSYFSIAEYESYFILVMAGLVPALLITGKEKLCFVPALGAWCSLLYPAIENQLQSGDANLLSQALGQSQRIMQEYAIDLLTNITELSWGGLLMLAGLVVLTLASLVRIFR